MLERPGSDPDSAALPKTQAEAAELQRRAGEKKQQDDMQARAKAYAQGYDNMIKEIWDQINLTAAEIEAAKVARGGSFVAEASKDLEVEQMPSGVYKRGFAAANYLADKTLRAGYSDIVWQKNDNGGGSLSIMRKPPTANDLINGMEFMSRQGAGKITLDWDSATNVTANDAKNIAKLLTAAMAKDPPVAIEFGPELKRALSGNKQLMDLQAESVKRYNDHWQSKNIDDVKQDLKEQHGVDVSDRGLARALEGLGPDENAIDAALPPDAQEAVAGARDYIGTEIADEGVKGELNRIVNEFATNVADPDKADTAIMDLQKELRRAAKQGFIKVDQESAIVDKALQAYEAVNDQNSAPKPGGHAL